MNTFKLSFLLSLLVVSAAHSKNYDCKTLQDNYQISLPQGLIPENVKAGDKFEAPIKVSFSPKIKDSGIVYLDFKFDNEIPGSAPLEFLYDITPGSFLVSLGYPISVAIPKNLMGKYKKASISFKTTYFNRLCESKLKIPNGIINVENDPKDANIYPPVITKVFTEKLKYKIGDAITVNFEESGKVALCYRQNPAENCTNLLLPGITYVAISDTASGEQQKELGFLEKIESGKYQFTFTPRKIQTAGLFKISQIGVYDQDLNDTLSSPVPDHSAFEID